MRIKQLFTVGLSLLCFASISYGEIQCSTSISYKWKNGDKEAKETVERWTTLRVNGATEEAAKATLQPLVDRNTKEARGQCSQLHENLSGCMSARYIALSTAYSTLGFQARKQMDEAIRSDCEKGQGQCVGVEVEEIKCASLESADGAEAAAGGDDKKAGEKGAEKAADKAEKK